MSVLDAKTFTDTAAWIASWKHPLLIAHAKPDGDALGALVAMRALLRSRGQAATALLFDAIPSRYEVFNEYDPMPILGDKLSEGDLASHDGVIVLDTCAYGQLDPLADWLRCATVPKLAVDHHVTRDELADRYLIDESAAACCLILYEWARAVDWAISPEVSEALLIGIAMDTGWFVHANTDERALSAAADLVTCGASPHALYARLYQRESPARVRLLGVALDTLELLFDSRLGMMALSNDAISGVGATRTDTEDIINEPLRIGSVVVSVLLVEESENTVRVSFRSKPPFPPGTTSPSSARSRSGTSVDVAKVAQAFGGGGHTRAAGARIPGTLLTVRQVIVEHLQGLLTD